MTHNLGTYLGIAQAQQTNYILLSGLTAASVLLILFCYLTQARNKREMLDSKKVDIVVTMNGPHDDTTTTTTVCPIDFPNPNAITTEKKDTIMCQEPGTYGSPNSSNDFFICHKVADNGAMEKIELSCPKGMMFDRNIRKCTKKSTEA